MSSSSSTCRSSLSDKTVLKVVTNFGRDVGAVSLSLFLFLFFSSPITIQRPVFCLFFLSVAVDVDVDVDNNKAEVEAVA